MSIGKYARVERERRFLLASFPRDVTPVATRHIVDRYLDGTRVRVRAMRGEDGSTVYKLTQKIPALGSDAQQGWITNIYLDEAEYSVFAQLPAATLTKTRYSVPPFGIDVFAGALEGLVLAEVEFDTPLAAGESLAPSYALREVSTDERFTGGYLVRLSHEKLRVLLGESR